eukprot:TRINITY_DN2100_c0_g1_i1.p1 TRINITY_DN2100_c0_g1~~TRINITY_DN2100_c0_g1_i1.p1  ORF type:complete len:365 (+),score=68.86 TRINITY_DN2100_c0_g1_i1:69-1163(+)
MRVWEAVLGFFLFLAMYGATGFYPVWRALNWTFFQNEMSVPIAVAISLPVFVIFVFDHLIEGIFLLHTVNSITLNMLGVLVHLLFPTIIAEVIFVSTKASAEAKQIAELAIIGYSVLMTVVGLFVGSALHVKRIEIESEKVTEEFTIAHLSDVHIGSRKKGWMEKVVNTVNELRPDYIMISGDLVDRSSMWEEGRALADACVPIHACMGNHDYIDFYTDMRRNSEKMILLRGSSVKANNNMNVIGVQDFTSPSQMVAELNLVLENHKITNETFNVLLCHKPFGVQEVANTNIDLMLSGHTHAGQYFIMNWLVKLQFPRSAGLYKVGDLTLYVNPASGTWGPHSRTSGRNTVALIHVKPKKSIGS